jgi:hypothetical protein
MHASFVHKNLQRGTFDTVNGSGRFIASAAAQQNQSPPRDGLNVLSSPPIPQDTITPTSLRSCLKRRPLESVPEEPDESPLPKRSRPPEDENVNWDTIIDKLRSMAQTSNEQTQSVPTEELSTSSAPPESPPPTPAPCDPPRVSRPTPLPTESVSSPLFDMEALGGVVNSLPQIQGLEQRFQALEDNQTALRSALSQVMDRLDAMEARLQPPPAHEESEGDPFGDPVVLVCWSWIQKNCPRYPRSPETPP